MESIAKYSTIWISHSLEMAAALIIALALLRLLYNYLYSMIGSGNRMPAMEARLQFGGSVAVSLELLLGADVLATAVSPSWTDLGKLAAIAVLRTGLNYFLEKELEHKKLSGKVG